MPWSSEHMKWLVDTGDILTISDGKQVKVFEFNREDDEEVLSSWARHFRNHYCDDRQIDLLRNGTGYSRAEYLNALKFPDQGRPGAGIRSGDFAEILISDYVEYVLDYWVPRTRYVDKAVRNESTKGVDIIGFKFLGEDADPADTLLTFEAKAKLTGNASNRLQDAINDSAKDQIRKAESLNAIKQRFINREQIEDSQKIARFQDQTGNPYRELSGAAAILLNSNYDSTLISGSTAAEHPNSSNMLLLVIKGDDLMDLVHQLYERAANEA
jgi:hypothetical protein